MTGRIINALVSTLTKNRPVLNNNLRISYNYLQIMLLAAILLPAVGTLTYIALFGVNIPYWDEWAIVPLVQKLLAGTLTVGDLFAQHNEHRILFPKMIMLVVAYFSHLNVKADMYISWLFSLTTFLIILKMYVEKFGSGVRSLALFLPVAGIFFSLIQFENLLWGWQIQIYLCVMAFILTLFFMKNGAMRFIIMAILCGFIATFSFINGLLVWPVGLFYLAVARKENWLRNSALWLISGAIAAGLFFYQWTHPSSSPSMLNPFTDTGNAVQYAMVYFGSPLTYFSSVALILGVILSGLALLSLTYITLNKKIKDNAMWISLILFSAGSAALCAVGRSGFGVDQALASRYTTFTIPGIIGLYLLVLFCWRTSADRSKTAFALIFSLLVILLAVGIIMGDYDGGYAGIKTHSDRTGVIGLLKNYDQMTGDQIAIVSSNVTEFKDDVNILYENNLSVFHDA